MKKVIALAALFLFAGTAQAQKKENYEYLGGNDQVKFFVNYKDGHGKYESVIFYGALVTPDGVSLSTFRGNCEKKTVALIEDGDRVVDKPEDRPVPENSPISAALNLTCSKRFGEAI